MPRNSVAPLFLTFLNYLVCSSLLDGIPFGHLGGLIHEKKSYFIEYDRLHGRCIYRDELLGRVENVL